MLGFGRWNFALEEDIGVRKVRACLGKRAEIPPKCFAASSVDRCGHSKEVLELKPPVSCGAHWVKRYAPTAQWNLPGDSGATAVVLRRVS